MYVPMFVSDVAHVDIDQVTCRLWDSTNTCIIWRQYPSAKGKADWIRAK